MSIKVAQNISLENEKTFTKIAPGNVGNLGKIIAATSYESLAKVQYIAQSVTLYSELLYLKSRNLSTQTLDCGKLYLFGSEEQSLPLAELSVCNHFN